MVRAKDRDGKEWFGWYFQMGDGQQGLAEHYLITDKSGLHYDEDDNLSVRDFVKIDITTAAVDTGKDAKNGRIYGSKGEMQGGDRVKLPMLNKLAIFPVLWSNRKLQWSLKATSADLQLHTWNPDELEIIKEKQDEA